MSSSFFLAIVARETLPAPPDQRPSHRLFFHRQLVAEPVALTHDLIHQAVSRAWNVWRAR